MAGRHRNRLFQLWRGGVWTGPATLAIRRRGRLARPTIDPKSTRRGACRRARWIVPAGGRIVSMANVTVVGAQWGDEGKGKIVDWLSNRADVVVRFQGGHNAGHTLVVDGKVYKLALLPSGVVQGKLSVIGSGVVVDPWHLLGEIEKIGEQGVVIGPDVLVLADNACLILPVHKDLDQAREAASTQKIGTTGRGIGP
eukprot:gene43114-58386_t